MLCSSPNPLSTKGKIFSLESCALALSYFRRISHKERFTTWAVIHHQSDFLSILTQWAPRAPGQVGLLLCPFAGVLPSWAWVPCSSGISGQQGRATGIKFLALCETWAKLAGINCYEQSSPITCPRSPNPCSSSSEGSDPEPQATPAHTHLALPRCSAYQAVILSSHISGVIWYRFITWDTQGDRDPGHTATCHIFPSQ